LARRVNLSTVAAAAVAALGASLLGCSKAPPAPPAAAPDLSAAAVETGAAAPPPSRPAPAAPQGLGALRQPAPMRVGNQPPALYEVGAFPLRKAELRPGPEDDRQLVEIYCVGCHSTAYIAMQPPLSRAAWDAEVQKMRGAYGAVISDPAASRIATYLSAYYGDGR
jgi:hypothetical protein